VLAVGDPIKIVLFGSRARGDARPDSDLDLLIVEESELPGPKRDARYYRALTGVYPSLDLLAWTPEEVVQWQRVPNSFIMTALREGKVLYAR
jgi:predicted nucleotidyltransferase